MKSTAYFVILFLLSVTNQIAFAQDWQNLRDGVIHIRVTKPNTTVTLRWRDAWISEAQRDHLYLQNPDGSLLKKWVLSSTQTPGKDQITLPKKGDYQLHVTGYSFRNIDLSVNNDALTQFEPVKIHKSVALPGNGRLYFHVPANQSFRFNAKHFGGVGQFFLGVEQNRHHQALSLDKKLEHSRFNSIDIPAHSQDRVWRLTWNGQGKSAFWLDHIPNLFALTPESVFKPNLIPALINARVHNKIKGHTPALGTSMPFAKPPPIALKLMEGWNLTTANHYTFIDVLLRKPKHDLSFLPLYEQLLGLTPSSVIVAKTGRRPVLDDPDEVSQVLKRYFITRHQLGLLNGSYIALADEPNLNYPSYNSFEKYFAAVVNEIKSQPEPALKQVKFAVPQSSRFIEGPTRKGADSRIGIDWADKLLQKHGQHIDAISWHQWMVRDLIDTSRYRDSVRAAAALAQKHQQRLDKQLDLVLAQTNISSGLALSPYEQNTQFAALWWASVVVQSSQEGELDQLVWFKADDDPVYPKGLAFENFKNKPVGEAIGFIGENMGHWVLNSHISHPELDLLATLSEDKKTLILLGVNKSDRKQNVEIDLDFPIDTPAFTQLKFGQGASTKSLQPNTKQSKSLKLEIDGKKIFVISGSL